MLRSAAATQSDLSSIVRIANDLLLCDTVLSSFFITAWIGLYDLKTGELSYCSQGHPPTMLLREGEIQFLSTQGMSLGVEALDPVVKKVVLKPYDLLLLYTDGITEAQDREKRFFGMERLEKFLKGCRKNSLQTSADRLLEEIGIFCNGAPQSDDVTFVLLRIAGKEGFLQRK
jgi:sigma-B regulation protein RsbU (phosphoserine phosphatase)